MTEQNDEHLVNAFIDLESNLLANPWMRQQAEEGLKKQLIAEVPEMVSRKAELAALITLDVGDYLEFMQEAELAYQFALWRSVVTLIGVAAENLTDNLYANIDQINSLSGVKTAKKKIFGDDSRLDEKRKIAILLFFGIITKMNHDDLLAITALRNKYAHGNIKDQDIEQDARKVMPLFRKVLNERFDSKNTVVDGVITPRQI